MPRLLLLGLASLAVAAALVPARHPYSYTYNVLDLPSNNNYQVITAIGIVSPQPTSYQAVLLLIPPVHRSSVKISKLWAEVLAKWL